jgi:hypothetical protein
MLAGLIDADIVIRVKLADAHARQPEARTTVAREARRRQVSKWLAASLRDHQNRQSWCPHGCLSFFSRRKRRSAKSGYQATEEAAGEPEARVAVRRARRRTRRHLERLAR